jgi:hypothetical protein
VGLAKHFCSFLVLLQSTHQLLTASMGHVTNRTPPGVSNPSNPRRAFGRTHRSLTAGMVHVTNPYDVLQHVGSPLDRFALAGVSRVWRKVVVATVSKAGAYHLLHTRTYSSPLTRTFGKHHHSCFNLLYYH